MLAGISHDASHEDAATVAKEAGVKAGLGPAEITLFVQLALQYGPMFVNTIVALIRGLRPKPAPAPPAS